MLDLILVDGIGPFFAAVDGDCRELNWSKIPFHLLERDGALLPEKEEIVISAFERFSRKAAETGFTGITLDDVAHLVSHSCYPESLQEKIRAYQRLYSRLFAIARENNLKVFITTDVMFFNRAIHQRTRNRTAALVRFLGGSIRKLFKQFPDIEGIIFRIGEADGVDVDAEFHSGLMIRTARQCRRFMRSLLPLFERYDRLMILRTWTVGAYPVGDLIWNEDTRRVALGTLNSPNLIVSHKYGETDFYRFLTLNNSAFDSPHQVMLELQARREYEGFGEYPSFVGYDYEAFQRRLSTTPNLRGICIWCQTGGWSHFRNLTYLHNSSVWNEINVWVTLHIFRDGIGADEAITRYASRHLPDASPAELQKLLRLSDRVVKELLYLPEFSRKTLFFRRTRVPPLLWVFWDTIIINHTLRKFLRRFVRERREAISDGYRALYRIREIRRLCESCGMDTASIDFMYDTFHMLAVAREYLIGKWDPSLLQRVERHASEYRRKHPNGYHVEYNFSPVRVRKMIIKAIFRTCLRSRPAYRIFDKVFFIRFSGLVYPLLNRWQKRRLPDFAREQAMGVQVLFK